MRRKGNTLRVMFCGVTKSGIGNLESGGKTNYIKSPAHKGFNVEYSHTLQAYGRV